MFLDIHMPGMDGFAVIEAIPEPIRPAVVFVTAHDEHAIRAFQVAAVDYLLKPFDRIRLRQSLERVRKRLREEPDALLQRLRRLLDAGTPFARPLRRIAVRSGGRIQSLRVEEVTWFEAADNYIRIHTGNAVRLVRETLSEVERRLDPEVFIRIHRRAIVKVEEIREVESLFHGDYEVVLRTGARLPVGRKYRDRLLEAMGGRARV